MVRRLGALFLVSWVLAVAACSSKTQQAAGTQCASDSDCSTGACLDFAVFQGDGGCSVVGRSCSKTCTGDGDCASLGANFKCFEACSGGPQTCGAT